jgi:hypothetical protein
MYSVLAILFLFLVYREIEHGPEPIETTLQTLPPAAVVG